MAYSLQTSADRGHTHCANTDQGGNGQTTPAVTPGEAGAHVHAVSGWRVLPGGSDGHIHQVLGAACQQMQYPMGGLPHQHQHQQQQTPAQQKQGGCLPCQKNKK